MSGIALSNEISLIVNPTAGRGRGFKRLRQVEDALRKNGATVFTEVTKSIQHAKELALSASEAGNLVVAYGGDGLIGAVGGAIAHTPTTLGALPGGRGNDFVRALGISQDPVEACEVVLAGNTRLIDVANVDGTPFLGIATIGFIGVANEVANQAKFVRGRLVYAYSGLRALASWEPAQFELTLDGETIYRRGYSVDAANSPYHGGGLKFAPDASLDDGMLDIVVVSEASKLNFLKNLPKGFKGTHVDLPNVEVFRARQVTVNADRQFDVYADGDPIRGLPATVSVANEALRVLVP